ncbi:hypothetical protein GYM96_02860 [Pseudomonas fragi]|uniref:hypothetical protein n=1 Tax=Pseudomonas fragi TaxID=296 RepID=UPI00193C4532|nr:hypothetical protein [Pseudomonas fragi]MBM1198718.1 hypothetical protein [Pseudomonas fragi]
MPMVKNVEKKIWDIQEFDVRFKTLDGKDVRGDKKDMPQYQRKNKSKNDMTVSEWKSGFKKIYPGYDVDVLDAAGEAAHGSKKLGTVRDTYNETDE